MNEKNEWVCVHGADVCGRKIRAWGMFASLKFSQWILAKHTHTHTHALIYSINPRTEKLCVSVCWILVTKTDSFSSVSRESWVVVEMVCWNSYALSLDWKVFGGAWSVQTEQNHRRHAPNVVGKRESFHFIKVYEIFPATSCIIIIQQNRAIYLCFAHLLTAIRCSHWMPSSHNI